MYRSLSPNSGKVAVSKITSRRWWCIESLFPGILSTSSSWRRTPAGSGTATRSWSSAPARTPRCAGLGEGQNGVSTNGVTANFMFFDRGTFWVLPLTYFYLPQSVKTHYFFSGPISVDPICPQPKADRRGWPDLLAGLGGSTMLYYIVSYHITL